MITSLARPFLASATRRGVSAGVQRSIPQNRLTHVRAHRRVQDSHSRSSQTAVVSKADAHSVFKPSKSNRLPFGLLPPRVLVAHLDEHVVGQQRAKKYLGVAIYNHFLRILSNEHQSSIQLEEVTSADRTIPSTERALNLVHQKPKSIKSSCEFQTPNLSYPFIFSPHLLHFFTTPIVGEALSDPYFSPSHPRFPQNPSDASHSHQETQPVSQRAAGVRAHTLSGSSEGIFSHDSNSSHLHHSKSNLLLTGPSGVGKTLLVSTLASVLRVPFITIDATPLTASGYVGEDVDIIARRLVAEARRICEQNAMIAAEDGEQEGFTEEDVVQLAQRGIVYIDEVDKLAARRHGSGSGPSTGSSGRDIGGEAVQQSLLRLLEGCVVPVQAPASPQSRTSAPTFSNNNHRRKRKEKMAEAALAAEDRSGSNAVKSNGEHSVGSLGSQQMTTYQVDTSSVLFILSGAFVGIEDIIRDRVSPSSVAADKTSPQMPTSALLDHLTEQDLITYGIIPELLGRVPSLCTLKPLTEDELVRIMTEPRNSLLEQYRAVLASSGVEFRATKKALSRIARRLLGRDDPGRTQDQAKTDLGVTGARGLRRVMEDLLLDTMFLSPGGSIRYALLDDEAAAGSGDVKVWSRGGRNAFQNAWAEEENEAEVGHPAPSKADRASSPSTRQSSTSSSSSSGAHQRIESPSKQLESTDRRKAFLQKHKSAPQDQPRSSRISEIAHRYVDPVSQSLIDEAEGNSGDQTLQARSSTSRSDPGNIPNPSHFATLARRKSRARLTRPSRVGNLRINIAD